MPTGVTAKHICKESITQRDRMTLHPGCANLIHKLCWEKIKVPSRDIVPEKILVLLQTHFHSKFLNKLKFVSAFSQ